MILVERRLCDILRDYLAGKPRPIPEWGGVMWRIFIDLCRTRASSGFAPSAITYAEIEAYARLTRWPLEPRHVAVIRALDDVWLEHARRGLQHGASKPAPSSSSPQISPQAFDAVFS